MGGEVFALATGLGELLKSGTVLKTDDDRVDGVVSVIGAVLFRTVVQNVVELPLPAQLSGESTGYHPHLTGADELQVFLRDP